MSQLTHVIRESDVSSNTLKTFVSDFKSLQIYDKFLLTITFFMPIFYIPNVYSPFFTPRFALLALLISTGLPALLGLLLNPRFRLPALFATLFLLITLISALISESPLTGIFGIYTLGTGWLFYLMLICGWSSSVYINNKIIYRRLVLKLMIVAGLVNAMIAIVQVTTQNLGLLPDTLKLSGGPSGLMENSAFLAEFLLAICLLVIFQSQLSRFTTWVTLTILALTLGATSEHTPIIMAVLTILTCFIVPKLRKFIIRSLYMLFLIIAGIYVYSEIQSIAFGSNYALNVNAGSSSISFRLTTWKIILKNINSHFLLGYGPGETLSLVSQHESLKLALSLPVNQLVGDAHNMLIEILGTCGILGFILFCGFIISAIRKLSLNYLVAPIITLGIYSLIEPQMIGVTPLLFLFLGASSVDEIHWKLTSAQSLIRAILFPLITIGAIALIIGDFELNSSFQYVGANHSSINLNPPAEFHVANALLPMWPESAISWARYYAYTVVNSNNKPTKFIKPYLEHEASWYKAAIARNETIPTFWDGYAIVETELSNYAEAKKLYLKALEMDPYYQDADVGLSALGVRTGNYAMAEYYLKQYIKAYNTPINGPDTVSILLKSEIKHTFHLKK
jgi:O-antigen ligase